MTSAFTTPPRPLAWRIHFAINRVPDDAALNAAGECSLPPESLDRALRRCMNQLKAEAIDPTGLHVDYGRLKMSPTLDTYRSLVACLQSFDLSPLTTDEARMAFWLNLYNALIIHTVIEYQYSHSITEERSIFDRASYIVNGYRFSANDIEHGILRGNRSHPLVPGPVFAANDPRRAFLIERLDTRLHAALNCAARSCPPISFYDPDQLDSQLDLAMRCFINGGGLEIDRPRRTVFLSRIFSWYASDFGGQWFGYRRADRLIDHLLPYTQSSDDRIWLEVNLNKLKVRFLPYDWSLNV